MEDTKVVLDWNVWLDNVVNIMGKPCYLLIKIDEGNKVYLLSASTDRQAMQITETAKGEPPLYMG